MKKLLLIVALFCMSAAACDDVKEVFDSCEVKKDAPTCVEENAKIKYCKPGIGGSILASIKSAGKTVGGRWETEACTACKIVDSTAVAGVKAVFCDGKFKDTLGILSDDQNTCDKAAKATCNEAGDRVKFCDFGSPIAKLVAGDKGHWSEAMCNSCEIKTKTENDVTVEELYCNGNLVDDPYKLNK